MKNLLILIILFIAGKNFAQDFEGTITWTMKMEITDPKKKAQLEEAQKTMKDPATQAKMKELEAQMKDPQFKAMMENNPQMKAQMEKMMGAVQSGDMNSMMPTGMTIKIKNQNVLSKIEGGMFPMEVLYLKDKNQSYNLDRENKTYSLLSQPEKTETSPTVDVKVTKTKETAKVLNYTCTKYVVEIQSNGQTMTQNVWATTEIKGLDLKALTKQRVGKDQRMFYEGIDGVTLKSDMKMQDAILNMEVTEIKRESLPASDFAIPPGFSEVPPMFKN